MRTNEYVDSLLSEIKIATEKIPMYTPANAIWHCGRVAYLAYAISRYIAFSMAETMDTEANYVTREP